ncbi:MAG: response regulator [Pseudomonadota bacterium]
MQSLIVEDDRTLSNLWRIALEREGHGVDTALDMEEATNLLRFNVYDMVLLDLFLQGCNALELAAFIGYTSPGARIVVVTGSTLYPRGEIFRDIANVAYVLRKPVPLNDLTTCVAHLERTSTPRFSALSL